VLASDDRPLEGSVSGAGDAAVPGDAGGRGTPSPVPCDVAKLASDGHNCGSCGHDCLGGSCNGGSCAAVTLATTPGFANGLASDATGVYWSETTQSAAGPGAIMKVALTGGTPVALASGRSPPNTGFAVNASSVFWNEYDTQNNETTIFTVPAAGGRVKALTSMAMQTAACLAASATTLYYPGSSVLMQIPVTGGTPVAFGTSGEAGDAIDMALDSTNLYWTRGGSGGAAFRQPLGGGPAVALLPSVLPVKVAADSGKVYVLDDTYDDQILEVGDAGAVTTVVPATSGDLIANFTVDSSRVYWLESTGSDTRLMSVSLAGGTPVILASGASTSNASCLVGDAVSVYWIAVTPGEGNGEQGIAVQRLAK